VVDGHDRQGWFRGKLLPAVVQRIASLSLVSSLIKQAQWRLWSGFSLARSRHAAKLWLANLSGKAEQSLLVGRLCFDHASTLN
jgi:hypothetical protein